MTTQRDTTLGATQRRLIELGYAPCSEENPNRARQLGQGPGTHAPFWSLRHHQAAIMLWPAIENGALVDDCENRRLIDMIVTAYLLSLPKELRAVTAVLESFKLLGGPCHVDGFGNRHYPLRWSGEPVYEGQLKARQCFPSDDNTILFAQAIKPHTTIVTTAIGSLQTADTEPVGTAILSVGGEWRDGDILATPRAKLPALIESDAWDLIEQVEYARWGARPLAQKDAA